MFNFDEDRFLRIQSGAVGLSDRIDQAIGACIEKGAENLFLLGTGGAAILMQPAAQHLRLNSTFPVFTDLSAELIVAGSPSLGPKSIVVIPSLSGTTKESVETLAFVKAKGATVISLTGHAGTPLAQGADYGFVNFAEDDTSCESFYLQSMLIVLSILKHRGEFAGFERVAGEFALLPKLLIEVKRSFEERAERFAEQIKAEPYHIITGAGSTWPEAFYYGMCILEEMQWIRTRPVHASDFFHGTLELVQKDVSVILFKGEDAFRPLVDRVQNFAQNYTDKLSVFDTAEFALPGISKDVRAMVSPVLLATILERVSAHLEAKRNHPLTTRRYYKRVAY
ncbi:SIS domain-containing protein [Chthonobacter rhizosphaerae]|uniref:SIS domain-containing protein n=1 Tax=Chthonobacter rhizosphaerae TaxID=2735553 RepID=UPI0015EE6ACC|nr:SIS domain-containing protein [Chthonobacter rhizosphaerae]